MKRLVSAIMNKACLSLSYAWHDGQRPALWAKVVWKMRFIVPYSWRF